MCPPSIALFVLHWLIGVWQIKAAVLQCPAPTQFSFQSSPMSCSKCCYWWGSRRGTPTHNCSSKYCSGCTPATAHCNCTHTRTHLPIFTCFTLTYLALRFLTLALPITNTPTCYWHLCVFPKSALCIAHISVYIS